MRRVIQEQWTPLHYIAAHGGHNQEIILKLLIAARFADVNAKG